MPATTERPIDLNGQTAVVTGADSGAGYHHGRVNSIAPGAVKTDINRAARDTPEAEAKLLRPIPCKRVGEPSDIAEVAVWLASDVSDYVHGASISADGGMSLYPGFAEGG